MTAGQAAAPSGPATSLRTTSEYGKPADSPPTILSFRALVRARSTSPTEAWLTSRVPVNACAKPAEVRSTGRSLSSRQCFLKKPASSAT